MKKSWKCFIGWFPMLLLFCASSFEVLAQEYPQVKVDVDYKEATMREILTDLTQKSGVEFLYNQDEVKQVAPLTFAARGILLRELLDHCLQGTKFGHKYVDGMIVITANHEKNEVKMVKIKGKITEKGNIPLVGATIVVKGSALGVASDIDGNYELTVANTKNMVLVVSFIGMKSQEVVVVEGKTEYNVCLEPETAEMEEVVVTGIFTKAKESYTGAVTTATSKELKRFGNRSVLSQLRNIDPAFNVLENNTYGSDPNKLPDIQLRGNTSLGVDVRDIQTDVSSQQESNLPLFVLDGFEISLQRVMDMDDNSIESITILKDASATAMYGSRGANGVVVITSVRPEKGQLRVTYRGNLNLEMPDLTSYDLMNAREKLRYEKAAGIYTYDGIGEQQARDELYNQRLLEVERGVDTYWLKYPVRTGVGHRHSLRIEGGDDNFVYAASIGYNDIAGVMKKSGRKTLEGNIYLSYKYKNVSFQNDLTLTQNKAFNSPYGSFEDYTKVNSYLKPYDDEGNLIQVLENYYLPERYGYIFQYNPLYNAFLPYKDEEKYFNVQNNFAIEWNILPELFVRSRFSVTKETKRYDKYLSREHTSFADYAAEDYSRRGSYDYRTSEILNYECEVTLNYSKTFNDKHSVYAGLSYNMAEGTNELYQIIAEGFPASNMDDLGMASAYQKNGKPTSIEGISRRLGAIMNFNYTYDRRYYIDLSGKLEGSSKFGADKRTAPFWSVGMGWNIHNEHFIGNKDLFNSLRLRLSYGVTGSQNFSPYQALITYKYYGQESYRNWMGAYLMGLGNKELGWQQTKQLNIGLEAVLFNGRVRLTTDFYNKLTDDLLSDITLPLAAGFNSYKANIGKVRNRGVELSANVNIIRDSERSLYWSVGGSLVHNKNKIMKISNSLQFLNDELNAEAGANPSFLFKEGQSMNTIFAVRSLGIDPSNGQEIFLKQDGTQTYTWSADDKVACGVTDPKVWGNLNTMLRYRGWSLNIAFSYTCGGYIYNQTLINKVENVDPWFNADRRALYSRWQKPGDDVLFKSVTNRSTTKASSRFVQKENSLTCRSINLNYEVDSGWIGERLGIDYFSVGLYAEDVFKVSTIKQERGVSYPFARKYSLSLTARF